MTKGNKLPFAAKLARQRAWIQAAFLLVWLDPLMLRLHGFCSPVFHCYSCPLATFACPIGVLSNFSALHVFPFVALGTLLVFAAIFGTFICGWACPFGFLQDLIGKAPTPKYRPPAWTSYFRYVVLVGLVLVVPYFFGEASPLFFCRLCPAGALESRLPITFQSAMAGGPMVWPGAIKAGLVVVFIGSALFIWRPWCTLFCPLGAIFALFNRSSALFLRFHPDRCNDCNLCSKLCGHQSRPGSRVGDLQCVRCLDCTRCDALSVDHVFTRSKQS